MALVEFHGVSRIYKSGDHELRALDNISFTLDKGKFVVILGQSGAGKSTLLNMLGGLDSPTSGKIIVDGRDISELSGDELAKYRAEKVGFVLQPHSEGYAEKTGITYKPDSVYTNTEKADIASDSAIKTVQSKQSIMDSFDTFLQIINSMIIVLVGGALILGIVVLYNLGVMSYTERYREMATLKVVGFKDKKIVSLLVSQNVWLSVIGIIAGIPLGLMTLDVLLKKLAPEYEMRMYVDFISYVISIILTIGMSLLVSLMVARKNKHIDMVEALKGAE